MILLFRDGDVMYKALNFLFFTLVCAPQKLLAEPATRAPIVIALDLHDVLMRYDKRELICNLLKKPSLVYKILWNIRGFFNDANIDNDELRPIYNFHKPMDASWEIVYDLKKSKNNPIYRFSNIQDRAFADLEKKFPGRFDIFDGSFSVPTFSTCKKPSLCAFKKFRSIVDQKYPGSTILFIDDLKKNVEAAINSNLGYEGIVFENAAQLRNELEKRGLLPAHSVTQEGSNPAALQCAMIRPNT